MINFESDYCEGAHFKILEVLQKTNLEQHSGYSEDIHCKEAAELIKKLCSCEKAVVHFLVGGTITNKTVIAASLRPHEAIISAVTGHINDLETGSTEACGHKILSVPSENGKISPIQIEAICNKYDSTSAKYHFVKPSMVYISNPTELGTIYTKKELTKISETCKNFNLKLYIDGARLGYGLASVENDLTLKDIASLCDAFYIGGTKIGALFGEALVIVNESLQEDFKHIIKQNGALLAKGRFLGLQFKTLFEDDLYLESSKHANKMAEKIREAFNQINCSFLVNCSTNAVFPILQNSFLEILSKKYNFSLQKKINENLIVVRIMTSWATKEENVDELVKDILNLKNKNNQ